jgi:effector-binding domain-containing protein
MSNKNIIGEPKIDYHPEKLYMGIRTQTPFKGMFGVVTKLFKEMNAWIKQHEVELAGPPFLRYHVIDMQGEMDIEVCFPVESVLPSDQRVSVGVLPAGRYASLIYTNSGLAGNKALISWILDNNILMDKWDDAKGDAFRSRYEAYLTDPKIEPRKTKWEIEVAIKLADDAN